MPDEATFCSGGREVQIHNCGLSQYIELVCTSELPGPLRHFLSQLDELRAEDSLDMNRVGRLLVELAADDDYLDPLIALMPSGSSGGTWLHRPTRGPRLVLFHRPNGAMACPHSHQCWVAIAPIRGVETHHQWDASSHPDGRAELRLVAERTLRRGDVVTLVPPGDIHSHGHVTGTGASPYSLVLLGDEMLAFERTEFDLDRGRWRTLQPGDPGRTNR
jgi:predicted metal-dependent enzyme (double-stranded beta helix superfamily)